MEKRKGTLKSNSTPCLNFSGDTIAQMGGDHYIKRGVLSRESRTLLSAIMSAVRMSDIEAADQFGAISR